MGNNQELLDQKESVTDYSRKVIVLWKEKGYFVTKERQDDGFKVHVYKKSFGDEAAMSFVFEDEADAREFYRLANKAKFISK